MFERHNIKTRLTCFTLAATPIKNPLKSGFFIELQPAIIQLFWHLRLLDL